MTPTKRRQLYTTLKALQSGALHTRPGVFMLSALFTISLVIMANPSVALVELDETQMEDVSGKGLAFAFDDFRFQMEPTSYFENIGEKPNRIPGATNAFKGDYRWIGTTISRGYELDYAKLFNFSDYIDESGTNAGKFNMNPTSTADSSKALEYIDQYGKNQTLSYPIAQGGAQGYAEINNPFVLRVRSHKAVGLNTARNDWVGDINHTALELVGATQSTPFRWAFWGEVDAVADNGALLGRMTNQEIIIGSPTSRFKPDGSNPAGDPTGREIGCSGSGTGITGCGNSQYKIMGPVFRMYQSMGEGQNDQTLGMLYHHRLSGDYRFSVNQPTAGKTAEGGKVIPTFDAQEGMYFMHVNAYLPMGQLHYQSLVVTGEKDGAGNYTGNFITETSQIPNDPNVFNDFYGYPNTGSSTTLPSGSQQGYNRKNLNDRYYETHGYVRWGNNFPTNAEFIAQIGSGSAAYLNGANGNSMPGTGVTNTKGYSPVSGNGVTSGSSINVTYHIKPYAINDTNFLNVYTSGLGSVDIGLCGTDRNVSCNNMTGSTPDITSTVSIGVTTPTPVGQGTKQQLISAGGMVFLAREGGSWKVPQNPNLASAMASASTNQLIFNSWDAKKVLTSPQISSGGTVSDKNLVSATNSYKLSGNNWVVITQNDVKNGYTDAAGNTLKGLDQVTKDVINANGGATAELTINGINLGSSRVEGMLIHHLKVTTLGAAN